MKKIFLLAVIFISIVSCKKYFPPVDEPGTISILGKWDISDTYSSPGGGTDLNAIPWFPVSSSNKNYLEFKQDGSFINSLDLRVTSDHYNLTDTALFILRDGNQMRLGYKLSNHYLEIYGNISFDAVCIEFCGSRYTPTN